MNYNPEPAVVPLQHAPSNGGNDPLSIRAFDSFAELCESVRCAPRRAEKSQFISAYFASLRHHELVVASRCLSGYIFPLREHRTLNISDLVILNCLAACAGVPPSFVKERLTKVGDLGDLASELFTAGLTVSVQEKLTLTNVATVITQLSGITGTRRKSELITRLLRKASALEVKYLVRIMSGDLNIGLSESDVEDAISRWKDIDIGRVQSANMLLGDIGETALLCANGKIDEARMRLFTPIKYMRATPLSTRDDLSRILPDQFIIEDKLDGLRAQVHIGLNVPGPRAFNGSVYDGLRIVIFSDILEDITDKFIDLIPGLAALMTEQAGTVDTVGVILDGQIVATRHGNFLPVSELRKRLSPTAADIESAVETPVGFVTFDQLFRDGRSLIQEEWFCRSGSLDKSHFDALTTFRLRSTMATTVREVEAAMQSAISRGSQGIVIKNLRSCYRPGRRGNDWFKLAVQISG